MKKIEKLMEEVSIPAWCDWETATLMILVGLLIVSIPAWCDWELV